jgi:hypothetical protein
LYFFGLYYSHFVELDKAIGNSYIGTPYQGFSVCVSGDATTIATGGYQDNFTVGAAWIFHRKCQFDCSLALHVG